MTQHDIKIRAILKEIHEKSSTTFIRINLKAFSQNHNTQLSTIPKKKTHSLADTPAPEPPSSAPR